MEIHLSHIIYPNKYFFAKFCQKPLSFFGEVAEDSIVRQNQGNFVQDENSDLKKDDH